MKDAFIVFVCGIITIIITISIINIKNIKEVEYNKEFVCTNGGVPDWHCNGLHN